MALCSGDDGLESSAVQDAGDLLADALALLDWMLAKHIQINDTGMWVVLLEGCAAAKDLHSALRVFDLLKRFPHLSPDVRLLGAMLMVYTACD